MGDEEKRGEGDVAFVSHLPVLVRQTDVSMGVLFFFFILLFLPYFSHPVSLDPTFHSPSLYILSCHIFPVSDRISLFKTNRIKRGRL